MKIFSYLLLVITNCLLIISCSKQITDNLPAKTIAEKIENKVEVTQPKNDLQLKIDAIENDTMEVQWLSITEAQELNKTKPKKMIVDFYTIWCGPCKIYDKTTFANKDVAKFLNKNYYAIKFNAEGNDSINFKDVPYTNPNFKPNTKGRNYPHQWSIASQISAYPTVIFMDENYNYLHKQTGILDVKNLEIFLTFFATNEYKNVTTAEQWQEYSKNFISTFKE